MAENNLNRFGGHGGLTLVPTSKFLGLANQMRTYLEDESEKILKIPTPTDIAVPKFGYRANREPFVQMSNEHICDHDCYLLASGPGSPEMLTELFLDTFYVVGRHASRLTLVCGYLPLSRSDKDEGSRELALLPHIVHMIESASHGKLHRIIACDLHSPQNVMASNIPALITEVSIARPLLQEVMQDARAAYPHDKIVIMLPDEGAMKRYEWAVGKIVESHGTPIPLVFGTKKRATSYSAKVSKLFGDLDKIEDSLVIGFDDEFATCSTQNQTAQHVKEDYGAKEYWGSAIHGVLCGDAAKTLADPACAIDRAYVTGTIPFEHRKNEFADLLGSRRLRIVDCWPRELAQIICYHHWGHSIRELR